MNSEGDYMIEKILNFYKGDLKEEEAVKFKEWLDEDVERQNYFSTYHKIYGEAKTVQFLEQLNSEQAWNNISKKITKPKVRRLHHWLPYVAAASIIVFVSVLLLLEKPKQINLKKDYDFAQMATVGSKKALLTLANGTKVRLHEQLMQNFTELDGTKIYKDTANNLTYSASVSTNLKLIYNNIEVPRGGEYSLILSDGTKVWLNSDSKLRYPVKFIGNKRDVFLVGEAYFEVAHNAHSPFIVHAHDSEVKVLGTKFNISSYEDQEFISTTLVEGSVEINDLMNSKILKPGYQSVIFRGVNGIDVTQVETHLYTSWVSGVFEFEDMDLEYIMAQLGRWYNVKFFFTEEKFKNIRFTGAIKRDNSFEFALDLIEQIAEVDFAIKDDYIIIGRPN